jgi:hypothetical protein
MTIHEEKGEGVGVGLGCSGGCEDSDGEGCCEGTQARAREAEEVVRDVKVRGVERGEEGEEGEGER